MRRKKLEMILDSLEDHPSPKPELEQYTLPGRIAADLLFWAYSMGDIEGKIVYDLGCGTGRLAIGAKLLGARRVVGVDVDPVAIEIARKNAERLGLEIEWIVADVSQVEGEADTVVQNPPFGCQRRGADRIFLEKALKIARVVYSIHRAGTEEFIERFVEECGGRIVGSLPVRIPIKWRFPFHRREVEEFDAVIYRIASTQR